VAIIEPARDFDLPDATMRLRVRAVELIDRGNRRTTVRMSSTIDLLLTVDTPGAESTSSTSSFDEDEVDSNRILPRSGRFRLAWYPFRVRHEWRSGARRRHYVVDPAEGFVARDEHDQTLRSARIADAIEECDGLTLLGVLSQPGMMEMLNGAVQTSPQSARVFELVDLEWVTGVLPSLIPPLPMAEVRESTRWKAGVPVLVSTFAEPEYVRSQFQLSMLDVETGAVGVMWKGEEKRLGVRPIPGIHHLTQGGIANVSAEGEMMINPKTGRLVRSKATMRSRIVDPTSPEKSIIFMLELTLEPGFAVKGGRVVAEVPADESSGE
jgi:hypothetical protein